MQTCEKLCGIEHDERPESMMKYVFQIAKKNCMFLIGEEFHPIDCMISEWSEWTECSATECGAKGFSQRQRYVKMEAKYGGEACPTHLNETKPCIKICEGKR